MVSILENSRCGKKHGDEANKSRGRGRVFQRNLPAFAVRHLSLRLQQTNDDLMDEAGEEKQNHGAKIKTPQRGHQAADGAKERLDSPVDKTNRRAPGGIIRTDPHPGENHMGNHENIKEKKE
jgi:hypothetical protein